MKLVRKSLITFSCLLLFTGYAICSGLSTNYSDVYIDNLKIGGSYNLSTAANYPMWINYTGPGATDISIEITKPSGRDIIEGYEPVPDISWVSLSKKQLTLLSGEKANVDVTITVPNDKEHLGKKYQAYVYLSANPSSKVKSGVVIALGIKGKLLFSIASAEMTKEEKRKARLNKNRSSQGLIIVPEKFFTETEENKTKIKVTEFENLKLINPSKETLNISLEAVDPGKNGFPVPAGYEKGELKEIKISKKSIKIKPDKVKNLDIEISLKNLPEKGIKSAQGGPASGWEVKKFYCIRVYVKSKTLEVAKFVLVYVN